MLLLNYYNAIAAFTIGYKGNDVPMKRTDGTLVYLSDTPSTLIDFDNTAQYYAYMGRLVSSSIDSHTLTSAPGSNAPGVLLGDGTAEPTINDYALSGNIVNSGLTHVCTLTKSADDSGITLTADFTITNGNDNDITISEVGLCGWSRGTTTAGSTGSGKISRYLVDRTLLENPITIPAGGVGQLTYSIHCDLLGM